MCQEEDEKDLGYKYSKAQWGYEVTAQQRHRLTVSRPRHTERAICDKGVPKKYSECNIFQKLDVSTL